MLSRMQQSWDCEGNKCLTFLASSYFLYSHIPILLTKITLFYDFGFTILDFLIGGIVVLFGVRWSDIGRIINDGGTIRNLV